MRANIPAYAAKSEEGRRSTVPTGIDSAVFRTRHAPAPQPGASSRSPADSGRVARPTDSGARAAEEGPDAELDLSSKPAVHASSLSDTAGFSGAHPFAALASFDRLGSEESARLEFRTQLTALAASIVDRRSPAPLDGLDPAALERGIGLALACDCFEDLDFLAPERAWPAVYAIAAALPQGEVRKILGRGVAAALKVSDNATFVSLATELVLSSSARWTRSRSLRARVALALESSADTDSRTDALALALVSRRELVDDWLIVPSTGSLGSRRLSARLLERASREAVRRAAAGDDSGVRVFDAEHVVRAFDRLLRDRESLVFRHVAVARGFLTLGRPSAIEAILVGLDPSLSPTEWRRSAVALAGSALVAPDAALRECERLLETDLLAQDPGLAADLVHGLASAIPAAPERVLAIFRALVVPTRHDAIEALSECRPLYAGLPIASEIDALARDVIARTPFDSDEGRTASLRQLGAIFDEERTNPTLVEALDAIRDAFAEQGADTDVEPLQMLVDATLDAIEELESIDESDRESRIRACALVRDVDRVLLESESIFGVVAAIEPPARAERVSAGICECVLRFANHLLVGEGRSATAPTPDETFARIRRVRTLLHLLDLDRDALPGMRDAVARVRRLASTIMLERVRDDSTRLHRALTATAARVLDARVRDDELDVVDVVHLVTAYGLAPDDLATLAEASRMPDVSAVVAVLAAAHDAGDSPNISAASVVRLANALPVASSARVDALRVSLLRVASASRALGTAYSLSDLAKPELGRELRTLVDAVGQMLLGASGSARRVGAEVATHDELTARLVELPLLVARVAAGLSPANALAPLTDFAAVRAALPLPVASALASTVRRFVRLPLHLSGAISFRLSIAPTPEALPGWVPLHRTIGDFVVERPIAGGALGSVFVARRRGEKTGEGERVAMKVPDYDASTARRLSEAAFLEIFRSEAGALLSVPHHANLARFVTFDVGARPKPILVMELVEGQNLERVLETKAPSRDEALDLLDGIAAGLEAMHSVGVGHLDLKPSNVIVRGETSEPVLVDFGLAGRRLRAGCGTANYGAPEIWFGDAGASYAATPADVYAFGCLAYELLVHDTLFDGDEVAVILGAHALHDGRPEKVAALASMRGEEALAALLVRCLRRDPKDRATISDVRRSLASLRPADR